jgi:hypothetical protein
MDIERPARAVDAGNTEVYHRKCKTKERDGGLLGTELFNVKAQWSGLSVLQAKWSCSYCRQVWSLELVAKWTDAEWGERFYVRMPVQEQLPAWLVWFHDKEKGTTYVREVYSKKAYDNLLALGHRPVNEIRL